MGLVYHCRLCPARDGQLCRSGWQNLHWGRSAGSGLYGRSGTAKESGSGGQDGWN